MRPNKTINSAAKTSFNTPIDGAVTDTLVIDATYTALTLAAVPIIIFIGGMVVGFYLAREYLFGSPFSQKVITASFSNAAVARKSVSAVWNAPRFSRQNKLLPADYHTNKTDADKEERSLKQSTACQPHNG